MEQAASGLLQPTTTSRGSGWQALSAAAQHELEVVPGMSLCVSKGITCVSVGHRPTLLEFHGMCLQLDGSGGSRLVRSADVPVGRGDSDGGSDEPLQ